MNGDTCQTNGCTETCLCVVREPSNARDIVVGLTYVGAIMAAAAHSDDLAIALSVAWIIWQLARVGWMLARCVDASRNATSEER